MKSKVLLLLVCMSVFTMAKAHQASEVPDHVGVVGRGEIEQEPDQAVLRISISANEPDLVSAKAEADRKYENVLKVIKKAGIDKKRVKATHVSAQPQYEWRSNKRIYKGELVSRSLNIKVRDLDKVSPLMQALVEQGVSTIDGIETGFSNESELQQMALGIAADDAKAKAEFLAKRLGRNLGVAYLINEQNHAPRTSQRENFGRAMSMATDAGNAPPPEMFGTQKIEATVSVSFYLL